MGLPNSTNHDAAPQLKLGAHLEKIAGFGLTPVLVMQLNE